MDKIIEAKVNSLSEEEKEARRELISQHQNEIKNDIIVEQGSIEQGSISILRDISFDESWRRNPLGTPPTTRLWHGPIGRPLDYDTVPFDTDTTS